MGGMDTNAPTQAPLSGEAAVYQELGRRIIDLRHARDLTQEQLAQRCELDHKHMTALEHGEVCPNMLTIWKLANGLDVDPCELLRGLRLRL